MLSAVLLLIKQQFVSFVRRTGLAGQLRPLKRVFSWNRCAQQLANQAAPEHRSRAAQPLYGEVSCQPQSCAPEAHGAPRTRRRLSSLLAVLGRTPRYQPKASADHDTAVCLAASVHQLQPSLYSPKFSSVSPLATARPQVYAGFKAVLKEGGFQPQWLATSPQASVPPPQELEAEMLFVLSMPLGCSAAALTSDKGHVWTGLNWNDSYVLDHGGSW